MRQIQPIIYYLNIIVLIMVQFTDFHTVKDLKFDIKKLQQALDQVLSRKKYDDE